MNSSIKKIFTNISIRGLFVALSKAIAFLTVPVIARAFGSEMYGQYSYVLAISTYLLLPSNWGFLAQGIREIAYSENTDEDSAIVSNILSTRIVLGLFLAGVFYLFGFLFFKTQILFLLLFAIIQDIISVSFIDYYYYGKKNVWIPSVSHFIGQVIYAILVLITIRKPNDILILLIYMVVMVSVESLILFYFSRKKIKIHFNFSLKNAINQFKKNFKLGMGLKTGIIQNSYPIIIIPFFLSKEILGNYSAVYKFYTITSVIMQMVILSVAPYIIKTQSMNKSKRKYYIVIYLSVALTLGAVLSGGTFVFSDVIINILFGKNFINSIEFLKWFSITILFLSPFFIALSSLMNYYSLDHEFMIGGFIQAGLVIVLSPLVLYYFNIPGLIIIIWFSMIISSCYYLYHINKNFL